MSRIAKSSPSMWEDIFRQNKENVLESIHSLQSELKKCERLVAEESWEELNQWMAKANILHEILD
jgi:prephenate dehydrogenase